MASEKPTPVYAAVFFAFTTIAMLVYALMSTSGAAEMEADLKKAKDEASKSKAAWVWRRSCTDAATTSVAAGTSCANTRKSCLDGHVTALFLKVLCCSAGSCVPRLLCTSWTA